MRGILLCGGTGSRLAPTTLATNKHLLPVYSKPMIFYPLGTLMLADIRKITVVTRTPDIEHFQRILGDGRHLGLSIDFVAQDSASGVVGAAQAAVEGRPAERVAVILGDNFFFGPSMGRHLASIRDAGDSVILATEVNNPEDFGVVEFDADGSVLSIEEKPRHGRSRWAIPGLYFFDSQFLDAAASVQPSERGELEITDVLSWYATRGRLSVVRLPRGTMWSDMGTPDLLLEVSHYVRLVEQRQGQLVAGLEEIAWRRGWISDSQLRDAMESVSGSDYGQRLIRILDA